MRKASKAVGAGVGAASGTVLIWLIELLSQSDIPEHVEAAIVILLTAAVTWLFPANKPSDDAPPG